MGKTMRWPQQRLRRSWADLNRPLYLPDLTKAGPKPVGLAARSVVEAARPAKPVKRGGKEKAL